eukprot:11415290-Karenia_brevis.AAC.1
MMLVFMAYGHDDCDDDDDDDEDGDEHNGCLCPSKWPSDRVNQKWDVFIKFAPHFARRHDEVPGW